MIGFISDVCCLNVKIMIVGFAVNVYSLLYIGSSFQVRCILSGFSSDHFFYRLRHIVHLSGLLRV